MSQLGKYEKDEVNVFRQRVFDERDLVVQRIEEEINLETLRNNKKLKREVKLEEEFKSMNKANHNYQSYPDEFTSRQKFDKLTHRTNPRISKHEKPTPDGTTKSK